MNILLSGLCKSSSRASQLSSNTMATEDAGRLEKGEGREALTWTAKFKSSRQSSEESVAC